METAHCAICNFSMSTSTHINFVIIHTAFNEIVLWCGTAFIYLLKYDECISIFTFRFSVSRSPCPASVEAFDFDGMAYSGDCIPFRDSGVMKSKRCVQARRQTHSDDPSLARPSENQQSQAHNQELPFD